MISEGQPIIIIGGEILMQHLVGDHDKLIGA